jgi:hypothetical protein
MSDTEDATLRRLARERIESGELSCERTARMWGSRGTGVRCALCGLAIGPDDVEYEVELSAHSAPSTLQFHLACHAIWHGACEACGNARA